MRRRPRYGSAEYNRRIVGMQIEQRKERRAITNRQPKGLLQVILGDHHYKVLAVKDASQTGVRLELGSRVNIGEKILVRYFDEKIDLKLNGVVMWNSNSSEDRSDPEAPSAYTIGIKLASPSLLEVFL
jgi:hypothetical protein